jgi:hypothetical protein
MTRFEQIAAAFPLHAQRIAELAGPVWLARARVREASNSLDASDILRGAFAWNFTSEGYKYWWTLADGFRERDSLAEVTCGAKRCRDLGCFGYCT